MFSLIRRRPARTERGLTRRSQWDPFTAMREEMESLFDRFTAGWNLPAEWVEPRDIRTEETDKEVITRVELPGFEATEIDLRLEDTVLIVRAEHPETPEAKEHEEHR